MKIVVRPVIEPEREIDLTHQLVAVIAEELWRLYGGSAELNWVEAEHHLAEIIGDARADAADCVVFSITDARSRPRDGAPRGEELSIGVSPGPRRRPAAGRSSDLALA